MQTPTTRYLCPLDCGWHHDSRGLPNLAGLAGDSIEDIIWAGIQRQTQADEDTIRQHLEAHPLIEWVTEVARLQRELNAAVAVLPACSDEEGFCDAHGFHRHPAEEPLRTPATGGRPSAWPEDGSIPWGGNAEDCPKCTGTNPPYPFLCPGHPAESVASSATGAGLSAPTPDIPLTSGDAPDIEGAGQ